jgi:hypothetical protein
MTLDWSSDGVDWRDESLDDAMARDWLSATHLRDLPANNPRHDEIDDVWERVRELTQSDLDPPRGWRLVKRLVELAQNDRELWHIGRVPLAAMVRNHGSLVAGELERLYRADPKWRQAFEGQLYVPPFSVANGGPSKGSAHQTQ